MALTHARLKAVNAVMEEGSYSAAARSLGMTQPAVSQAIRKLEQSFQVNLFESKGRMLVPTDFCLELTQITAQIEKLENDALLLLDRGNRLETGRLRIGLGNTMPGMEVIGRFKKRYPTVKVDINFGNYNTIVDNVLERTVDLGILPNVPNDGRFHRQVCLQQKVVAIVPPLHALANKRFVSLRELGQYPLIFRSKGSSTQKVVDRGFQAVNLGIEPQMILESRDGVCEAVANGLGIGFIWSHGTSRSNGIIKLEISELDQRYDEVVFRRSDYQSKLVDAFFSAVA